MEETPYYEEAKSKHPEILEEWVERVLESPQHIELQPNARLRYYGYIPEADKWLRVIISEGKLHNRFFDSAKLKRWGRP